MTRLNNGFEMPLLGIGTYRIKDCELIKFALLNGYRLIDTAYFYQNEEIIGKAVNEVISSEKLTRDEIFVSTKLWCTHHSPEHVEMGCRRSLKNLNLDYVDLYLMHSPIGYEYREPEDLMPKDEKGNVVLTDDDYLDTWKAMEKLVDLGLTKSIGVSNFNSEQITRILQNSRIKPVTNQVECNPTLNQKKLIKFCKELDITVTAYSPLTRPYEYAEDPTLPRPAHFDDRVKKIGEKHGKSAAQVVLRFLTQFGVIPIPTPDDQNQAMENLNIFDFELSEEEIKIMESFHTGQRSFPLEFCRGHKYFMFGSEF